MPTANQYPGVDPWSPDPPEPKVPLDAYRRSFVEPEEEFVEPPEEVESEEMIGQEPSAEPPSEPDEARVGDEEATPSTNEPTIEELIATAEKSGDWLRSGQLKVQRMSLQGDPSGSQETHPESETVKNLMAQISDAETNADWYKSGLTKFRLMSERAAAEPSGIATTSEEAAPSPDAQELEAKILRAEEAGSWAESLRLKAQKIPGVSL